MERIFISYAHEDETFARRLATDLYHIGANIWMDSDDIPPGVRWHTAIEEGLNECEIMVVVFTPASVASDSVRDEWTYFLAQKKPLIPVWHKQLSKAPFRLHGLQYIDFCHETNYAKAFSELRIALRGHTKKPDYPDLEQLLAREKDARFRFLVIDPASSTTVQDTSKYVGLDAETILNRLEASLNGLGPLVTTFPDQVAIKLIAHRPSCGYLVIDPDDDDNGFMTVAPYFYKIDRLKSETPPEQLAEGGYLAPILRLHKNPVNKQFDQWFEAYLKDFHRQWNAARFWTPPAR